MTVVKGIADWVFITAGTKEEIEGFYNQRWPKASWVSLPHFEHGFWRATVAVEN